MRKEVSQLTNELHQRDITIATLSGSTSSVERQLRAEVERAERRAAELKVEIPYPEKSLSDSSLGMQT